MRYLTTNTRPVNVMDQLFGSMFYDTPTQRTNWKSFSVDIIEEDEQYVVSAELPGFVEPDVDVTLNDNLMVISANKDVEESKVEEGKELSEKSVKYLLRERTENNYKRSFSLPKDADRESIKATLKDGLLNLSIGKKPEAKPLSIKIN